ncbi:hypothetical protein DXG03_008192 [Asterophora parasitica]|uniref:Uncharacterized protein n=1 Tax=Asterophora parasitica TaxID=117018 RepID=A0A9P7G9A4_9AGAR|nr:hypothetical protein DXG03_008192 [Asterophora parasitica]
MTPRCEHTALNFSVSAAAQKVGYSRATLQQRVSATIATVLRKRKVVPDNSFPAPLVLPGDDLFLDPGHPAQGLRSWLREEDRNEVTPQRNVIYVAAPPAVDTDFEFLHSWTEPQNNEARAATIPIPCTQDVMEYLAAFYHGLPVRSLPSKLCFAPWDSPTKKPSKSKATIPRYIAINSETESVRIRTRRSKDGIYTAQLNLDDLLDAAISILPDDAYALLLIVHHDLYESADDEFVCGRAYGGSRVAVISSARYHPILDGTHNVERQHAWPASHCAAYMDACCKASDDAPNRPKKRAKLHASDVDASSSSLLRNDIQSPMHAALNAHISLSESLVSSTSGSTLLWLTRLCRTASHELGHCFGMDHCVYYACSMQGSASLVEDARQPPYLCPVDLAKLLYAVTRHIHDDTAIATGIDESTLGAASEARYRALLSFCDARAKGHLFAAYGAWIRARLAQDFPPPL